MYVKPKKEKGVSRIEARGGILDVFHHAPQFLVFVHLSRTKVVVCLQFSAGKVVGPMLAASGAAVFLCCTFGVGKR